MHPAHWVQKAVRHWLASLDGVRVPLSTEERGERSGDYPYYGASGVIDHVDDYLFDEPLVLVSEDGANLLLRSTPISFLAAGKYWVNNHAHVLRPFEGPAEYWAHRLEAIDVAPFVSGAAQPKLTANALMNLRVAAPTDPVEQERIVRFIRDQTQPVDRLITEQQRLVELLLERRRAVVDRVVWLGLDLVEMSATGVEPAPAAPAHWRRCRNKELFFETTELSEEGAEELLTVSHLTGITLRSDKNVNMIESESLQGYRVVACGDLVINTMWAWMGALAVSGLDGVVSPAYGVYRPRVGAEVDPDYFDYLYRSRPYVAEMTRHSRGVWESRLRLYPETFLRLPIVVPSLEEQRAIALHLDEQTGAIDKLIAEAGRFIELAQERRSALITAAVTGQIDVRDVA
jgi:type I restriction enzyme S subunit